MIAIGTPLPYAARPTRLDRFLLGAGRTLTTIGRRLVAAQTARISRRAARGATPAAAHRDAAAERIRDNAAQVSPLALR